MRYIVGDIHGCYQQYQMLLEKIQFSEKDELYVLGDVVDRGPEPIKVLQDMMKRTNVIFILGNHDFIMYTLMKKLSVEITEENYDKHLTTELLLDYNLWLQDGGRVTAEQFSKLSYSEKMDMLDLVILRRIKRWMSMIYTIFWKRGQITPKDIILKRISFW